MTDLLSQRIVGESGAGLIKVTCNGVGEITKVEIDDLIFKKTDKQLVSDLFVAAVRDVTKKVSENAYNNREAVEEFVRKSMYNKDGTLKQ